MSNSVPEQRSLDQVKGQLDILDELLDENTEQDLHEALRSASRRLGSLLREPGTLNLELALPLIAEINSVSEQLDRLR